MKPDPEHILMSSVEAGKARSKNLWLALGLLLATSAWLIGWYWETATSIVATWANTETYAHGYLILPISLWLVWRERDRLATLPIRPTLWPMLPMALLGFAWLAADAAQVGVVRQYSFVLMQLMIVWAILGTTLARAMAFPLAFLVLAVPFGESFIWPLINFTADFTVGALRLTGLPVFREGNNFTLPSGSWSVVEACSGVRYLIASVTLGALYAYLTYRRLVHRVLFVGASILVPILANGVRAYMIVMIGHLSGMKLAVGVDHLIYGWVFFGLVMLLLFWVGSFWREDEAKREPRAAQFAADGGPASLPSSLLLPAIAIATLVVLWPAAAARFMDYGATKLELPPPQVKAWQEAELPASTWMPQFSNANARLNRGYVKDGQTVGVFIAYYQQQTDTRRLVSSVNGLTVSTRPQWVTISEGSELIRGSDGEFVARAALLRGADQCLLAWYWYAIEGSNTTNPIWAKVLQARNQLLGRGDDGAAIVIYAPYRDRPDDAARLLRVFVPDALPAIRQSLEQAARR